MSILGTCPECLHHTDGMCDLRPRICLNYDHFERRPMVTLTRDDFEKLYISRAVYDELNAKVAALQTALRDIYEACYAADCDGELDSRIDGAILDAARIALKGGE